MSRNASAAPERKRLDSLARWFSIAVGFTAQGRQAVTWDIVQRKRDLTVFNEKGKPMSDDSVNRVAVDLLWTKIKAVRREDQVTLSEAFRRVRYSGEYDFLPEPERVYAKIQTDLDELVELRPGPNGPIVEDQKENWYGLHASDDGVVWGALRQSMESGGMASAVGSIDSHSTQIVQQLAEPFEPDSRRRGLVIGHVQSGKTANYAAVIAKAVDAQYKMVVVLAGIHSNLRAQTQRRLTKDLGIDDSWVGLTDLDRDMGRQAHAVHLARSTTGPTIAVIKKHKQRLANLDRYLADLTPQFLRDYPILIIDDESDQASPDSAIREDDVSTIHELLRKIWGRVRNGSYVSYTATPFANLFMEPNHSDSLYPKDFIHVLPEPEGYLGTQRVFGIGDRTADPEDDLGLDVLRDISNEDRELVVPPRRKRGEDIHSREVFCPQVPNSLKDAISWFVLGTAVRRYRGQSDEHSSMLVHTTHEARPHFGHRDRINAYLALLRSQVLVDGDYSSFEELMVRELPRVAELRPRALRQPSFVDLKPHIRDVLADVRVYVDNGSENAVERVQYRDDRPVTAIIVGGNTLSRGLTLEGLFVSYFARNSLSYDTLLQMGRWFGFRPGYGDLLRLWLSEGLAGDYQFLADVESQVRSEIRLMQETGLRPSQVGVRVKQHPGRLSITGRGKMKHVRDQAVGLEGRRVETNIFDISAETLLRNIGTAEALISDLDGVVSTPVSDPNSGSVLYQDVPYEKVRTFIESYVAHGSHSLLREGNVVKWLDKWDDEVRAGTLPAGPEDNLWNVVILSGGNAAKWSFGDVAVKTINRAPLTRKPSSIAEDKLAVGIRALMSASDHLSDLKILRATGSRASGAIPTKISEANATLMRQSELSGRGLLVLYIIDKDSYPRRGHQDNRSALETEHHVVGFGMMAPSNPSGRHLDDEVFVAVTPEFAVDDEFEEDETFAVPDDLEGDYVAGGNV